MRWTLVEEEDGAGQGALFAEEEIAERHVGTGEYRGLEFLHVRARSIINEVPGAQRLPFRWTINPYRGCSHACAYCTSGDTPVLLADGRHVPIAELEVGAEIYGTERVGNYLVYKRTAVLAKWETLKRAYRVTLEDGTSLIASGDHRFLTNRGWKFVTGTGCGNDQRPHLTSTNHLLGTGKFAEQPKHDDDYRLGYLAGAVPHSARLESSSDREALDRIRRFVQSLGRDTAVERIEALIATPRDPSPQWLRGFLAGFFDAGGSCSRGVLRMSNTDPQLLAMATAALDRFGFRYVIEPCHPGVNRPVVTVRLLGGQVERMRFFHTFDPAITRKRDIAGVRFKNDAKLRVVSIEDIGVEIPMYDITTGTGDFIANGVVSHNCFARPTHDYLGMNVGSDFDSKIVVKVNAVEKLRSELAARRWAGDHIAMGTNTDPYQRCEGKYHLTQGIVRVLGEFANPFSILTKSTLILRDLPLLVEAAARTDVGINFSIGTLDERTWKLTEPGTPHPKRRIEAVRKINDAGIPCGVLIAPILPGLSDAPHQLEEVVRASLDAGAVSVRAIPLHLRRGVKEHFMTWLADAEPSLVPLYRRRYRGAYLPRTEHEAITATVRRVLSEVRGPATAPPDRERRDPVKTVDVPFQDTLL